MSTKRDDGGPAYPIWTEGMQVEGSPGMSMRDWLAAHAPHPTENEIDQQYKLDKARNPYNTPDKPPIRDRARIIADLAFQYADAMITARKDEGRT